MIPQFEPYNLDKYSQDVKDQIDSSWVGYGPKTKEFEDTFAKYVGSKYAISTSSGTASILVSIAALSKREKESIATSNYSFIAASNAIRFLGFNLILCDIDYNTLSIDPDMLHQVSKTIDGVVFINHNGCGVHFWYQQSFMGPGARD